MARVGKLTAVEVAKAKGPKVLHDGGGLYLRVAPNRRDADDKERPVPKPGFFVQTLPISRDTAFHGMSRTASWHPCKSAFSAQNDEAFLGLNGGVIGSD